MYYLCLYNNGNYIPLEGPMRSDEVVDLIQAKGDLKAQTPYCNASRYELWRYGNYPKTREGDAKLLADMAANSRQASYIMKIHEFVKSL